MFINLNLLTNLLLTGLIATSCFLGDFGLQQANNEHLIKALIDNTTHQLIGLLSTLLIILNLRSSTIHLTTIELLLLSCFGTLIAGVIDVDHFIEARSMSLSDATRLPHRPFLHNSLIPLVLLTSGLLLLRSCPKTGVWLVVAFCSVATHHVRDAQRRGLWFGLLGSTKPITTWLYVAIEMTLPHLTFHVARLIMKVDERKIYLPLELNPIIAA